MTFWIVTSGLALAIAVLLALVLLRGRSRGEPAAAYDLRVYREQLRDVDRDLARGVIAEADADRIRTEVSRRILAADGQLQKARKGTEQPRGASLIGAALGGIILIGGSLWLYRELGAPGYGDLTLQTRLEQAEINRTDRPGQDAAEARVPDGPLPEVEESYRKLVEQLRETASKRPDDIQGQQLLARHEANLGHFKAAYEAQARVIALREDGAEARDHAEKGELMIMAAGGYVSPEAEAELRKALDLDPGHGPARYYWGLMLAQIGRPDLAFEIWDQTMRRGPTDAPWLVPIRAQIEDIAYLAGVRYDPPVAPAPAAPLAAPTAEDMQNASEMSEEDRQEMIRGMVDRLSDRLASEGGSPQEWARLIGALGVLGDTDQAKVVLAEARSVFAGDSAAIEVLRDAAVAAGLTE